MAQFDRAIPPGGEGRVTLKVDLKGYQGDVKKTATVFSNDPQNARMVLAMQGKVKALIEIRPSSSISFRGLAEQLEEKTIDMVSVSQPFHIQRVESNLEDKVGYQLETVEEGKHYRLKVANRLKQGNYNGYLKAYTDHPKKPDITLRVNGYIEGEIAVKPQTILIGKLAAQQPARVGKVIVISNRNKRFAIKQLSYDARLIKVTEQPLPKEQGYSLEIVPNVDAVAAGDRQQTVLTIETDATPAEKQEVQIHVVNFQEVPRPTGAPPSDRDAGGQANPSQPVLPPEPESSEE